MTKEDVKSQVSQNIRESEFGRRLPGVSVNTQQLGAVLKELVYKAKLADTLDSIIDLAGRFGVEDNTSDVDRAVDLGDHSLRIKATNSEIGIYPSNCYFFSSDGGSKFSQIEVLTQGATNRAALFAQDNQIQSAFFLWPDNAEFGFSQDNLNGSTHKALKVPISGLNLGLNYFPVSVNNQFADENGSIKLNLQSVTEQGYSTGYPIIAQQIFASHSGNANGGAEYEAGLAPFAIPGGSEVGDGTQGGALDLKNPASTYHTLLATHTMASSGMLFLPNAPLNSTLVASVGGVYADANGNISIAPRFVEIIYPNTSHAFAAGTKINDVVVISPTPITVSAGYAAGEKDYIADTDVQGSYLFITPAYMGTEKTIYFNGLASGSSVKIFIQ